MPNCIDLHKITVSIIWLDTKAENSKHSSQQIQLQPATRYIQQYTADNAASCSHSHTIYILTANVHGETTSQTDNKLIYNRIGFTSQYITARIISQTHYWCDGALFPKCGLVGVAIYKNRLRPKKTHKNKPPKKQSHFINTPAYTDERINTANKVIFWAVLVTRSQAIARIADRTASQQTTN